MEIDSRIHGFTYGEFSFNLTSTSGVTMEDLSDTGDQYNYHFLKVSAPVENGYENEIAVQRQLLDWGFTIRDSDFDNGYVIALVYVRSNALYTILKEGLEKCQE